MRVSSLACVIATSILLACGGGQSGRSSQRSAVPEDASAWARHLRLEDLASAARSPDVIHCWFDRLMRHLGLSSELRDMPPIDVRRRVAALGLVGDASLRAKLLILALAEPEAELREHALAAAKGDPGSSLEEIAYIYSCTSERSIVLRCRLLDAVGALPRGPKGVSILAQALHATELETRLRALRAVRTYLWQSVELCAVLEKSMNSHSSLERWAATVSCLQCDSCRDRAEALFTEALEEGDVNQVSWALSCLREARILPKSLWKRVGRMVLDRTYREVLMDHRSGPVLPMYNCFAAYEVLAETDPSSWQIEYLRSLAVDAASRAGKRRDDPCIRAIGLLMAQRGEQTEHVAGLLAMSLSTRHPVDGYAVAEALKLAVEFDASISRRQIVPSVVRLVSDGVMQKLATTWLLEHLEVSRTAVLGLLAHEDRSVVQGVVSVLLRSPAALKSLQADIRKLSDQAQESWRRQLLLKTQPS